MGKLFVIESGTDCSGKATQTEKLYQRLLKEGYLVKKIEFPNYKSESSALVKMYLSGKFGTNPNEVNPYVSSSFYAMDRFASYKTDWEDFYQKGGIILADRYTTSNMVHQAEKLLNLKDKEKFLQWLYDFEYVKCGLPIPNKVLFLDITPDISYPLILQRNNKFDENAKIDIHERNKNYLINTYLNAQYIADKYNWVKIDCIYDNKLKSIPEIHELIYSEIIKNLLI